MNSILHQLRKVVSEEKTSEILKEGIIRDLGSVINYSSKLEDVVKEANDRLEVLERTGRPHQVNIKPSILLKFANHSSSEVRTFVARSLPVTMLERYMYDRSPHVRHATAKRISMRKLNEMVSYYTFDDELLSIQKNRLEEKKIPKDVTTFKGVGLDLSDGWYDTLALKVVMEYNGNIEGRWDEIYRDQYSNAMKATSHVAINKDKLYNAIQKVLRRKEQEALRAEERGVRLSTESKHVTLAGQSGKSQMLTDILSSRTSSLSRVQLCNDFFTIKETILPPSHRSSRLSESRFGNFIVPARGTLPEGHRFSYEIETALDLFEESWNRLSDMNGEPLRIKWSPDPTSRKGFLFVWETK
jgi:hypothetical protein